MEDFASEETVANTSNFVYIQSTEYAWIPARIVEHADAEDEVEVQIPVYRSERQIISDGGKSAQRFRKETISFKDYPNQALPLQNVNAHGKLLMVEDMVDLPFLHEVSLLNIEMNDYYCMCARVCLSDRNILTNVDLTCLYLIVFCRIPFRRLFCTI